MERVVPWSRDVTFSDGDASTLQTRKATGLFLDSDVHIQPKPDHLIRLYGLSIFTSSEKPLPVVLACFDKGRPLW
ncbi:hypothetical protein RRG08_021049 [Elysia crispata]|uniref:Uncharacterized protein n=1 Tax=Elysia crispata TaxID=231223 RepID=A0AAE0YZZ8_9GAST|nr:hypothetical protein RRG08_021049 [Elysia crispata]